MVYFTNLSFVILYLLDKLITFQLINKENGNGYYLFVFVERKCINQEYEEIQEKIEKDPDCLDSAHIFELNESKPFLLIGKYPVVLINHRNKESWYVCEKLINVYDLDRSATIELDLNIEIKKRS